MKKILVTNDDGIDSEGLQALRNALARAGEVVVIAPGHNWSATGHAKTMHRSLRADRVAMPDGSIWFRTDGTPSDCVALGMLGLDGPRPDLVVSGINKGANLGEDVTYSGTVGAAMESVISGVPAIAVSLAAYVDWRFEAAADFASTLAAHVLSNGMEPDMLLNVNVPNSSMDQIRGVLVTRLGRRTYHDALLERLDPRGQPYYWIGGDEPTGEPEEGTDIWALANGYISMTPIHLDLTNYAFIEKMRSWNLGV